MTLSDLLLLAVLAAAVVAVLLLLRLSRRRPEAALQAMHDALQQALRSEQREGRLELRQQLDGLSALQEQRIEAFGQRLDGLTARTDERLERLREALTEDARRSRLEAAEQQQRFADALGQRLAELTQRNEQRIAEMRRTLDEQLQRMQADNAAKLEQMRATVEEKLQSTLETRLGESFRLVSERLEQVHRGLGEMQQLASGVGDLKRVLGNVKTRGTFGEVQLGALLEQVLTRGQYEANVATVPGSGERVEYAVRLPGAAPETPVRLPIDAKFPREDYERLLDAQERADAPAAEAAGKAIENRLRLEARTIREKYIAPPHTTDFGILFVPTEGLYAEALRRPGLVESLQREHKVMLCGPTTLLATLTSLQMGFRTLALEKRSAEVWEVLGAVKTEFGKFGDVLAKARKKLEEAGNTLDAAEVRTRAMTRKLKTVEALPDDTAQQLLQLGGDLGEDAE